MREWLLDSGWQLRERTPGAPLAEDLRTEDGWVPARVPGTVHQDLLAAGRIPDPFYGENERQVPQAADVAVVADGADWIWNLADDLFPDAVQIVDVPSRFSPCAR